MDVSRTSRSSLLLVLLVGVLVGALARDWLRPASAPEPTADATTTDVSSTVPADPIARQPLSVASRRAAPDVAPPGQSSDPPTPEAQRGALDARLRAEPVSASWARYNEAQVRSALGEHLLAAGIDAPLDHRVECRTTLCRIDVHTRGGETADATEVQLLQGISDGLANARIFRQPHKDGTVALVIYASGGGL